MVTYNTLNRRRTSRGFLDGLTAPQNQSQTPPPFHTPPHHQRRPSLQLIEEYNTEEFDSANFGPEKSLDVSAPDSAPDLLQQRISNLIIRYCKI